MGLFQKLKTTLSNLFDSPLKKIFFFIFFIFVGILIFFLQKEKKELPSFSSRIQKALENPKTAPFFRDLVPQGTALTDKPPEIPEAPQFKITSYNLQANLPSLPDSLNLHVFKTDFNKEEAKDLALKLLGENLEEKKKSETQIVFSNQAGFLAFDLKTGAFTFQSFAPQATFSFANQESFDPRVIVGLYLKQLGIIDEAVKATAYYKRNEVPEVIYIEFHRDWERVGLPILNPVGIINLAEGQDFDNLSLTSFAPDDPTDEEIVFASDTPGQARKTDFNTLTLAVTNDGRILSIESSLRPIEKIESLASLGLSLLEPEKIIFELEAGGSYFDIALPSGQGVIDLAKVYPENKLSAKKATVTDLTLALMEKPKGVYQKYLQPVYLVRGYTETETGIRVKFAQTVPALEDQTLTRVKMGSVHLAKGAVLGEQSQDSSFFERLLHFLGFYSNLDFTSQEGRTIQLGTFFSPTPSPSPSPTPSSTPTPALPTVTPTNTPAPLLTPTPTAIPTFIPTPTATPTLPPTLEASPSPSLTPTPKAGVVCFLENTKTGEKDFGQYFFVEGLGTLVTFEVINQGVVGIQPQLFYVEEESIDLQPFALKFWNDAIHDLSIGILKRFFNDSSTNHDSVEQALLDPNRLLDSALILLTQNYFTNEELGYLQGSYNTITGGSPLDDIFKLLTQKVTTRENIVHNFSSFAQETLLLPSFSSYLEERGYGSLITLSLYVYRTLWFGRDPVRHFLDWYLNGPCRYLSGNSPSIYFYPQEKMSVQAKPRFTSKISYSDPPWPNWQFVAYPAGQLDFHGAKREKLYYEYTDVTFAKPKKGWAVEFDNFEQFLKTEVLTTLCLNSKEKEDLLKDIKASLIGKETKKYVFVSLIPREEVEEKLPIAITPLPDNFHRMHLYLEFLDQPQKVAPHDIITISRSGLTVVELGVYVKE